MSEHEPDEPHIDRSLIDEARPALGPSEAQRARLKRAVLAAAVGSAAAGTAAVANGTGASATTAGVGLGTKIAITVFAVAAVGGGAWLANRDEDAAETTVHAPPSEPAATTRTPTPVEDAVIAPPATTGPEPPITTDPAVEVEPRTAPRDTASPRTSPPDREPRPAVDDLASVERETELLREAHSASQRGDARAALALLEQHARTFPRGALATERRGLRILALCDVGEVETARREVQAFLRGHPPAGLAQRVERSCAGGPPETP